MQFAGAVIQGAHRRVEKTCQVSSFAT